MAVAAVAAVAMAVAANTTDVFYPAEVKCTKINSLYFLFYGTVSGKDKFDVFVDLCL